MKILWLCNLIIPQAAEKLGIKGIPKEGWVEGLLTAMSERLKNNTLAIAFPVSEEHDGESGSFLLEGEGSPEISYYCFQEDTVNPDIYDPALENRMNRILDEFRPDIVHIFGTEFPHTLAMAKAACNEDFHFHPGRDRVLVTFQGVCAAIASDYMACLPEKVINYASFRDTVRKDSIKQQQEKFRARAVNEVEALKTVGHIGGRTSFDKKWAERLGEKAVYHYAGEVMRPLFYEPVPENFKRNPNTIFIAGGDYPLKGLHVLLKALEGTRWPQVRIRVAGQDIVTAKSISRKIKISGYGKYLQDLIKSLELERKITFLGRISASQMREEYLKCGMFVCPSSIENSPNSIVEAALMGTPVIASRVGGIPDVLEDKTQCLLFDFSRQKSLEEVAAGLRECIMNVKSDPKAASERARAARARVLREHDPEVVASGIYSIYSEMNGSDQ